MISVRNVHMIRELRCCVHRAIVARAVCIVNCGTHLPCFMALDIVAVLQSPPAVAAGRWGGLIVQPGRRIAVRLGNSRIYLAERAAMQQSPACFLFRSACVFPCPAQFQF